MILDNLWVPPNPGVMPRPVSGCPKSAFVEAILISQAMEISQPPPSAKPLIAAMTGFSVFSIKFMTLCPFCANLLASTGPKLDISAISAPATKDLPAPVRITHLTFSSWSITLNTSNSSSRTVELRAFSASGLSMVTVATLFFTSYLIV